MKNLPSLSCIRCGHKWQSRKEVIRICPKCKSAYWDIAKRKREKQAVFCKCGKVAPTGRCRSCANRERRGNYHCNAGESNPFWKGDLVGNKALHAWVGTHKPKTLCELCGAVSYDLANVSGEYKRDVNDFQWLCRRCHMQSDGRMKNLDGRGRAKTKESIDKWRSKIVGRKHSEDIILKYKEAAKLRPKDRLGRFEKPENKEVSQ